MSARFQDEGACESSELDEAAFFESAFPARGLAEAAPRTARRQPRARALSLRAFFAVPLPEAVRARLGALVETLRAREHGARVRWVRAENMHITLRFLGNVAEEQVGALSDAATDALRGSAPVDVALGAPSLFPSARAPKLVALACEPQAGLAGLAARLEAALAGFQIKRASSAQAFRAHITLGRLRTRRCPELAGLPPSPGLFRATRVQLFRSELRPEGACYNALATFVLAENATSARVARTVSETHPATQEARENDHAEE